MYISETLRAYPCSFMESAFEGIRVNEDNLLKIWKDSDLFRDMRRRLNEPTCNNCSHDNLCKGGCPVFPGINLCSESGGSMRTGRG